MAGDRDNVLDPGANGPSRRVLVAVIEDDHSFRRALGRSLELQGFQTETFASAEEFLQRSSALPTDCIVLDIHLGEMSGLELQAELAAASVRTPIVFITAFDDPIARQRALEGGAAGLLQKPFGDGALTSAIARAVAGGLDALD